MKLRILLLCTFALIGNAFADDGAKIMERKTCEQINGEIAYLSGLDSLSADEQAQLKQLNQQQRSYCTTKAYLVTEMHRYYDVDCVDHKDAAGTPAAVTETGSVAVAAAATPTKTDEEIAAEFDANLAAGLCGDGSKPSRFGCCAGETFKDLGDLGFACCPRTGNVCYPPVTPIM